MKLSDEEKRVLLSAKAFFGRSWKFKLQMAWMYANYPSSLPGGMLQRLRNSSRFGPAGLIRVRKVDLGIEPPANLSRK